jgi:hypothetical protein
MTTTSSITVNGKSHALADLSEAARVQVGNIQLVDAEIARLQQQLAIAQTARNAYVAALVAAVESPAAPVKKARARRKS